MIRSAFNLQEVLAPLMARYGRRLHGEKGETYEGLVRTVSESLEVDWDTAGHLVTALRSSKLIVFERTDKPEVVLMMQTTASGYEETDKEFGVWSLGPTL